MLGISLKLLLNWIVMYLNLRRVAFSITF